MRQINSMENCKLKRDYLTFVIDDKTFAVPILSLMGVIGNPNIIPIKEAIEPVLGVFYMNNFNVPIFDLRLILNKPDVMYPNRTCVLVVRAAFKGQEKLVGFIVDSLYSIYHIQISEIEKLSAYSENEFIEGVITKDEKMVMILALEKIINKADLILFLNQFWNYENNISEQKMNGV